MRPVTGESSKSTQEEPTGEENISRILVLYVPPSAEQKEEKRVSTHAQYDVQEDTPIEPTESVRTEEAQPPA